MNYKRVKESKAIINYPVNRYFCNVVINGRWFTKLVISQYYKSKKGRSTVSDEIIQKLVNQLNYLKDEEFLRDNKYYNFEPLYVGYRAYNLVWDYDEEKLTNTLLIIDCYREKKYDLK
ncbi:MAG: hypothetical protein mread185_000088 [Mycoplasmataceae bacterium]|nr:MAG: hypothetical protein mread185_000088 [Mycoplasmataceae bacterium]